MCVYVWSCESIWVKRNVLCLYVAVFQWTRYPVSLTTAFRRLKSQIEWIRFIMLQGYKL